MGRKRINVIGRKFGHLEIVEEVYTKKNNKFVRCKCDCGGEITTSYSNLVSSATTSCRDCRKRYKKYNDYEIEGDIVKIKLTNGVAIVDLEDWDKLKYTWWNDLHGTVQGWHNGNSITIYKAILEDIPKDCYITHKDGDLYNNRKSNLIINKRKIKSLRSKFIRNEDLENK